ncbi:MAG: hypothetical protein ABR992_17085 [Solirubrobacteraceae bacterium]|jgi:hypothetical protein
MSQREPEITSHRQGATIGVNRDGMPVGVVTDLGNRRFAMRIYTTECPWEEYAGVASSEAKAVSTVGLRGETPAHMEDR